MGRSAEKVSFGHSKAIILMNSLQLSLPVKYIHKVGHVNILMYKGGAHKSPLLPEELKTLYHGRGSLWCPLLPEELLAVMVANGRGVIFSSGVATGKLSMLHWVICLLTIELLEFLINILEVKPWSDVNLQIFSSFLYVFSSLYCCPEVLFYFTISLI